MSLFNTYLGMYLSQCIAHSLITLYIVETSLRIWKVRGARSWFWYRFLILFLPLIMYPIFQVLNPLRGSFYFLQDTVIFSTVRWMVIYLWGTIPVGLIFLFLLFLVSMMTFIQEVLPIIRSSVVLGQEHEGSVGNGIELDSIVSELTQVFQIKKPFIRIVSDERPIAFTKGIRHFTIYLSDSLLQALDAYQIRAVLAHEMAHIANRSNVKMFFMFLLRILMFFNPVSLLIFRRIIQYEEYVCDDLTVSVMGDSQSLIASLFIFLNQQARPNIPHISDWKESLEISGYNLLLKERILRLKKDGEGKNYPLSIVKYGLTLITIFVINYFVV